MVNAVKIFEGYFYSFDEIMSRNYMPETIVLENTGYLIFANTIAGDHLVIDTKKGNQLAVKRIYMPEMGEWVLNPSAVHPTGCSITTLYQYMAEERGRPTF